MRIDFVIIGAQKCGTTSLAAQLAGHSEVCFSRQKEPAFFNTYSDWQARLDEYHNLYSPEPGQICGEASTMYTFFPESVKTYQRLYEYNPDVKLIYMMREPVERIISHYTHNYVRGIVKEEPEEIVFSDSRYVNRSRYGVQLRPYLDMFGEEQIFPLIFEEYVKDPDKVLSQLTQFLNINSNSFAEVSDEHKHHSVGVSYLKYKALRDIAESDVFQSMRTVVPVGLRHRVKKFVSNQIDEKPEFSKESRQALAQLLQDDISMVESLLGRPIEAWQQNVFS